jgi:hypothetical protein
MEINTNILKGIKDNLIPFILTAAAVVCGLVGLILFAVSSAVPTYFIGGGALAMVIIAFIALLADLACIVLFGADNKISAVLGIVAIVLATVVIGMVISARVLTIAAVFSYDSGNVAAWKAVKTAIATIIALLISVIVMMVCGFFSAKKN